jgi:hypothetical protein
MVANASIVGVVAGIIIAIIMQIHIANAATAPPAVQAVPHQTCDRIGLSAGTPAD